MTIHTPVQRFGPVAIVEGLRPWQRRLAIVIAVAVAAWSVLRSIALTILDRWWLQSMTEADVWSRRLFAQLQLSVGVAVVVAAILGGSLWYVFRLASVGDFSQPRGVVRYHERMGPAHRWLLVGFVIYMLVTISAAAAGKWRLWMLFRHGGDVGVSAPIVGGDLGYHLFDLPFYREASSFLRQLVIVAIGLSAFGHLMSGALRLGRNSAVRSRAAIGHLVMLVTLLLGLQTAHYLLVARPSTATNRVGAFDGPGYTERFVSLPGFVVLAIAAILVMALAAWSSRRERYGGLIAGLAGLAVLHGAVVWVIPSATERFIVAPAEAERQLWSISANLDATVSAFGLDRVDEESVDVSSFGADTSSVGVADTPVAETPIFETGMMAPAMQVLAGTTGTRVVDVDLNRLPNAEGDAELVYLAARSASRPDVPESGWVQEHLVYTHGDGVVVVPATRTDADGRPDIDSLSGVHDVAHDPLYFGERLDGWYVITGTKRAEIGGTEFEGTGVDIGSTGSRLVLALAMGESDPLLSSELTSSSQLLYRRSLRERVGALAPFLALDGDPYPVLDDGRVVWILDGYTTSSSYPSAQFVKVGGVPGTSGLAGKEINYLHSAVRATIDAETGETHLFRTDRGDDPILDAWARIFPDLLEPAESFPESLRSQVRYPDDLWTVQSGLIGRYHVDDAETLFSGAQRWAVSAAAATSVGEPTTAPSPSIDEVSAFAPDGTQFGAVRPYGPGSATNPTSTRDELSAIAVAGHGGAERIRLVTVLSDQASNLLSPQVAQSAIDANPDVAQAITLLNANGSKVQFGPMSPVATESGIVWTRPIIVIGTGSSAAPRLYGVAAVSKGQVAVEATANEAIASVIG